MYSEGICRMEGIDLSWEIPFLRLDSKNPFCKESLPGNLPDQAYLIRISGNNDYLHESLLLNQDN